MKANSWALTLLMIFNFASTTRAEEDVRADVRKGLEVVSSVDLEKYVGKWHEIALIPNRFQRQCVANTTAEYTNLGEGMIRVDNSCKQSDGSTSAIEGRARVVDPLTRAKLEVTFVKLFTWIFLFGGDYWVIQLDQDYGYAVVGHPERKFGWILARTPSLPPETLKKISTNLIAQGYDTCAFAMSPQDGGVTETIPLCEYLKKFNN